MPVCEAVGYSIRAPLDLNKIQAIRLVHAMAESELPINIPPADEFRFTLLRRIFGFSTSNLPAVTIEGIGYDHAQPHTFIGPVSRPLIYPRSVAEWCRNAWPEERDVWASFCGLITPARSAALASWVGRESGQWPREPFDNPIGDGYREHYIRLSQGMFHLRSSWRGRRFPIKAWDSDYYSTLLRSRFVLCPNGEYAWSYRFFEAALCGAIPVVEEDCAVYRGFHYYRMSDRDYAWDSAGALHNYQLCAKRILVPAHELRDALQDLAERAQRRLTARVCFRQTLKGGGQA